MKLVLLDRDGVLNEERLDYVKTVEELAIFPNALTALALFKQHGFTCAVVTNQSVVGRGIIEPHALDRIHHYLCDTVKAAGGEIADILSCTDDPKAPTYRRKPKPGMLIEAMEKFGALSEKTPIVGDNITDMQAGLAAGCPRFLVKTGKSYNACAPLPDSLAPVTLCRDILDAAQRIIGLF